uniref:Troponin I n=1 Tax=Strongyloides stercoralis TaxID=6248 RepID=A0AAF5DNU7_STRER
RFFEIMSNDWYPEENDYIRYGGCQGEDTDEESARKNEERERKKAEVRKRLEEAGNKKKSKKGFLTPERKKKLRKLLMMKAAEDLKQQQLLKEQERQKILSERTMPLPAIDGIDDHAKLEQIYNDIFNRLIQLEEQKYDINQVVLAKDQEINELTIAVNDLRGKFVKPVLKKVSKYDNKFKKMAETKKEDKQDFRANLKVVKKETVIDDLVAKKKFDKPDWSKKGGADGEAKEEKAPKEETQAAEEEAPPADEEVVEEVEEAEEEEEEEEEE